MQFKLRSSSNTTKIYIPTAKKKDGQPAELVVVGGLTGKIIVMSDEGLVCEINHPTTSVNILSNGTSWDVV